MSAALDKSLDDIISSKPKKNFKKSPKNLKSASKISKTKTINRKAPVKFNRPTAPAATKTLDASYATKVVVHGLPKDIKQDAIKEFFQSQVGGVVKVILAYNEKGLSTGNATVDFKNATNASKAVEKYNGAPIDNGSSRLKLELIIDPTKKPLASRILANSVVKNKLASKIQAKKGTKVTAPINKKAQKPQPKKQPKKQKKSIEELDQEMADYFDK